MSVCIDVVSSEPDSRNCNCLDESYPNAPPRFLAERGVEPGYEAWGAVQ